MFPLLLKGLVSSLPWCKNDYAEEIGIICDTHGKIILLSDMSTVKNGDTGGKCLGDSLEALGAKRYLGGNGEIPFKATIFDTKERMPIEVADKQSYASYELVYIIKASETAKMLYGFSLPITERELRVKLKANRFADLCNIISVKEGDVFTIPSGTPWALGDGIIALVINGANDKKYCLFDYGRKYQNGKSLPLDTEKAIRNLDLLPPKQKSISLGDMTLYPFGLVKELSEEGPYLAELLTLDGNTGIYSQNSFIWLYCISGNTMLSYPSGNIRLKTGSSVLIPENMKITLTGNGKFISVNLV